MQRKAFSFWEVSPQLLLPNVCYFPKPRAGIWIKACFLNKRNGKRLTLLCAATKEAEHVVMTTNLLHHLHLLYEVIQLAFTGTFYKAPVTDVPRYTGWLKKRQPPSLNYNYNRCKLSSITQSGPENTSWSCLQCFYAVRSVKSTWANFFRKEALTKSVKKYKDCARRHCTT